MANSNPTPPTPRVGDVVIVNFPFEDGGESKIRPALVVDIDGNGSLRLVACQITSNNRSGVGEGHWIAASSPEGMAMGLDFDSFINMNSTKEFSFSEIKFRCGHCPEPLLDKILVFLGYR